jgi:hypothetical protein
MKLNAESMRGRLITLGINPEVAEEIKRCIEVTEFVDEDVAEFKRQKGI